MAVDMPTGMSNSAEAAVTPGVDGTAGGAPAGGRGRMEPPSVLVLTKDEELNIGPCLECFRFTDDVVVLDSHSTDRTLEIAGRFPNVLVVQRKFDTWSNHSNWAIENIKFKHRWVYYSDADERMSDDLREEIIRKINDPALGHVAYRLRYRNMFMGQWLRHGGVYPVWIIRLYRPDKVHYEQREVNAHPVVDGSLGELEGHFTHYSFNKGLVPWLAKHNSYSTMEAHEAVRVISGSLWEQVRRAKRGDEASRRRAVKNLSFFLPFRALARFCYMYFLRMGMLDGWAGFHYAAMISMYEYWIELKIRDERRPSREATERLVEKMLAEAAR